jgi:energy-coupling factor transporter ATP-binding protein EcfA2
MIEQFGTAVPAPRDNYPGGVVVSSHSEITGTIHKMWGIAGTGEIFHPVGETTRTLPCGFYRFIILSNLGLCIIRVRNDTDSLIELPDSESDRLLAEMQQFLTLRTAFRDRGLLYKRGVMLYGPPGSGKTATIQLLAKMVAEHMDSIAILADAEPSTVAAGLQMLRGLEPTRQLVVILEDLDALVGRFGDDGYLSLLDGENQVENVIYVATTNYPERLDRRFVDRPSRFDTLRMIGMPTPEARRIYLRNKEPSMGEAELAAMVEASEGYSIAHLRELLVLVKCFGQSIPEASSRLDGMREAQPSSDREFGKLRAVGFGGR